MISDLNKNNLVPFINDGDWLGDIANKVKNLVGLYESKEMPTEALVFMCGEMLKMTSATATSDQILRKDELNGVINAIVDEAKAQWV